MVELKPLSVLKKAAPEKEPTSPKSIENHLDAKEPRWFAIRTRFKSEKLAYKQLNMKEVEAYLPIRSMTRKYNRKLRKVEMPLINSFVFVRIVKAQYVPVLETEYVSSFLKFGNNILCIPDEQIKLLRRLLGEDIDIEVTEEKFSKGDWVEVTHGALMGLKGRLVNIQGKERVLVEIMNSGFSIHMEMDNNLLHKINVVE
jgi:transcription antitermination factor NusG